MRLTGVRTVLHITEVNETERELLKRLGFQNLQETDMADSQEPMTKVTGLCLTSSDLTK